MRQDRLRRGGLSTGILTLVILACGLTMPVGSAQAEDRSVTIIEGVPEPVPETQPPANSVLPKVDLKAENPASLTLDILPNADLAVGTEIAFRIGTAKPGYLVLVDVNAEGKIAQIYPNVASLSHYVGTGPATNQIRPGAPVRVPDAKNPLANFIFKAQMPRGLGVVLAVLSDNPVQIIDLPEDAAGASDPQSIVDFVGGAIRTLKLTRVDNPGQFSVGVWSIAAKAYVIR